MQATVNHAARPVLQFCLQGLLQGWLRCCLPCLFPAVLLTLAGCHTVPPANQEAAAAGTVAAATPTPVRQRLGLKLSPASLGQTLSLQQHMIVQRNGRTDEIDTVLEIDPTHLTLVGLAFGQRILTLDYDGKELKTWRHFMLPPQVRGEDVLEDLQLTLWPAAAIRAALPPDWDLQDSGADPATPGGMRRTLSYQGKTVALIDYPTAQRWGGTVVLENLRYHYRLTILSASDADGS